MCHDYAADSKEAAGTLEADVEITPELIEAA
jgi:hypothetical protein